VHDLDGLLSVNGGALLDRARSLVTAGRVQEAIEPLEAFLRTNPPPDALADARLLLHRAQFARALALVDVTNQAPDPIEALRQLGELAAEPYDAGVFAAKMARASLQFTLGSVVDAERALKAALEEWRGHSNIRGSGAGSPLDEDVRRIRDLIFRPKGGGWLDSTGWRATDPPASRPFLAVSPAVSVKTADGREQKLSLPQKFSESAGDVLFLGAMETTLLGSILDTLAGRVSIVPAPPGFLPPPRLPAADLKAFWNRFLYAERTGQWGESWSFWPVPVPYAIEFLDEPRTRAAVRLALGNTGVTLIVEQTGGGWRFVRVAMTSVA
jgi:hypothetical protein